MEVLQHLGMPVVLDHYHPVGPPVKPSVSPAGRVSA